MLLGVNPDFSKFEEKFWHNYLFTVIILTSFFHVILLLNLMIAIMSNTFETVMEKVIASRNQEHYSLVLMEGEVGWFRRYKAPDTKEPTYLYYSRKQE